MLLAVSIFAKNIMFLDKPLYNTYGFRNKSVQKRKEEF